MTHIPIVDLSKLKDVENVKEDPEWISVAAKVREGLETVGFLHLVNHGIPEEVILKVLSQSQKFFALDSQVKLNYKKDTTLDSNAKFSFEKYAGYTPPGGERLYPDAKLKRKETYDWLDGRGVYPDKELPEFEPSISQLHSECMKLMKKFLRLLAISLEMVDVDFFAKCCRFFDSPKQYDALQVIRLLYYPPLKIDDKQANSDDEVRLGAHTDSGFITLLFQDDTGGLEVKTVDGNWLEAKPIEGSVLVNTGDLIEFWTCGIFPATPHRVVIPDVRDEKRSRCRYSIAFFNGPDIETIVTPTDLNKTPKELERLAKTGKVYSKEPVNAFEYVMGRRVSN